MCSGRHARGVVERGVTYSKGTRSVTGGGPAPSSVQAEALVGDDPEDATAAEGLGVCLSLDLENVEGEEDDLSDTDQAALVVSVHFPHMWIMRWGPLSTHLPAVECMMALPVFLPKAFSKSFP